MIKFIKKTPTSISQWHGGWVSQPHFEGNVRSPLTLPKMGLESPLGLPNIQSSIAGVKKPRLEVFFIPLKRSWSVDVQMALHESFGHLQHKLWSKEGPGVGSLTPKLKVGKRPDPGVCRWSATHRWKDLKESYKFASDLIPIGGLSKELWAAKVLGVQTGAISGQFQDSHLGVPGQKGHLDVAPMEWWPPWSGTEYTIWGNVVASLESRPWWVKWVQSWRAPKSQGETPFRIPQSQVAESWDLEARSRLSTLERGRGSSWEPRD
jgi:hypothetical protein